MRLKFTLLGIAALASGLAGYWFLIPQTIFRDQLGFSSVDAPLFKLAVGYVALVIGAFLGSGFRALLRLRASGQTEVSPVVFASSVFKSIDFWLGLFGSPIVFSFILKGLDQIDLRSFIAIALQNGFLGSILVEQFLAQRKPVQPIGIDQAAAADTKAPTLQTESSEPLSNQATSNSTLPKA